MRTLKEFHRYAVGIFGIEAAHVAGDSNDFRGDFHATALPPLGVLGFDLGYVETEMSTADIVMMEVEGLR